MSADVLVVDDEADIRELVAGILEDEGYAVRTAADSDQALAAIRARKPALLVLDIWMQGGGMDGLGEQFGTGVLEEEPAGPCLSAP